jgi:hypothetical protein
MPLKKIFVVNNAPVDQQFLRGLFSSGITSALRKPSPARWAFSGGTLVQRDSHKVENY